MKVTIDTINDSHESIKKAIKMLQAIVGEEVMTNSPDILEKKQSSPMDIFASDTPPTTESSSESESPIDMLESSTEQQATQASEQPVKAPAENTGGLFGMFGDTSVESSQSKDIFSNEPTEQPTQEAAPAPIDLFSEPVQAETQTTEKEEPISDDKLFEGIFTKEELQKMDNKTDDDDNTKDIKTNEGKPHSLGFY